MAERVGFEYAPRVLSPDLHEGIYLELNRIEGERSPARKARVLELAEIYGVSPDTVYRAFRTQKRRYEKDPKVRSDAGQSRTVDLDVVRRIWELQHATRWGERNERRAAAHAVIHLAEANGIIEPGSLSLSTYYRLVDQLGLNAPDPRIRIEEARVNQRHLMDGSGSKFLKVVEDLDDGDYLIRVRDMEKNRRDWKKEWGLWLVGIIDGRSRCFYANYVVGPGESSLMMLKFIQDAWAYHPEIPFGGLPEVLQVDNGAFARRRIVQDFFQLPEISIRLTTTEAGAKESQGKIENPWKQVWRSFEAPLLAIAKYHPNYEIRLSDLNAMFHAWIAHWNQRAHPIERSETRAQIWTAAMSAGALRQVPENLAALPYAVKERTVSAFGDFQVSELKRSTAHEGWYHVDTMLARRKVHVWWNAVGEVFVRDPKDPRETNYPASPGRRETQPTYDELDDDGRVIRVGTDYATGTGLGRRKTPGKRIEENPQIPAGPMFHPFEKIAAEGVRSLHLAPHSEDAPKVRTPFTTLDEYPNEDYALEWISDRLGVNLGEVRVNYQAIWIEIEQLLKTTLERDVIESHAADWAARIHARRAAGGGGA